ncbi:peptidase C15, pyroglutamyl peptidase I-like protein [Zopfia rhizophila CBS 207.26]|uniref:Peptidase C15, pyroglutamyl peptidase I-like protein n=1 Tax=Zopfia rhizophila CBS 207.26 TaxID=1314779 RepID=A0A6A6DEX9_9PEZI|nr:peptidase C15, pyroglutamyl peptidase I-like protein [Zopfia rhizophila CBS 207.26]
MTGLNTVTKVLITGFGAFQGVPSNPSWGIAQRLPSTLPNNIELIAYTSAIPVAYHPTIILVPKLIAEHQPDIALHMGVAADRDYFAVEQTSQREPWPVLDIEGQNFSPEEVEKVWTGQPQKLSTDLDLHDVVAKWQNRTQDIVFPFADGGNGNNKEKRQRVQAGQAVQVKLVEDVMAVEDVRWSDSVGNYLCAFIYYADLVEMKENGKSGKRDVAFMHVPMLEGEQQLGVGVDVTVELVQSLVESWRAQQS